MSEESVPLHTCIHKQHTQHHCRYLQMQTCPHKKLISSEHTSRQTGLASLSLSLLFPSLSGPFQCWVGNEFENCPISFALSEMSLSTGEQGYHGMLIYFSATNKINNIFFFFSCRTCNKVIWCLQQISHISLSSLNVWSETLVHTPLGVPLCCGFTIAVLCYFSCSPACPTALFNLINTKKIILASFDVETSHRAFWWRSVSAHSRGTWG